MCNPNGIIESILQKNHQVIYERLQKKNFLKIPKSRRELSSTKAKLKGFEKMFIIQNHAAMA